MTRLETNIDESLASLVRKAATDSERNRNAVIRFTVTQRASLAERLVRWLSAAFGRRVPQSTSTVGQA